jgi:predicted dehydrogenase
MQTVRIGVVGAGVIGATHSAVLQQIAAALPEQVELVAVADPIRASLDFFTSVYGYKQTFGSAEELLADGDINTVFVCTPTCYHAEAVHAAAARRLNVFCEKPLAMNVPEAEAMVEVSEQAQIATQIGLVLRFSAVYTVLRELMRDPRAGRPMAVVFRDDQVFPIRGVHDSAWRADRTQTAGGTLIEHGVHDLDILTWLFGPVQRLRAWEQNRAGHPGIEDYVAVELEFGGGLRAQLVNVWHNMVQRPSNRRLEIFCDNAFLATEADMNGSISFQYGDGPEEVMSGSEVLRRFLALQSDAPQALQDLYGVAYLVQDLAFVQALLAGNSPAPPMRVGLAAQRLAAAVYHSARTGTELEVTDLAGLIDLER